MSRNFKRVQLDYYDQSVAGYEAGDGVARALNRGFARKARLICGALGAGRRESILEVGAGSGLMTWFAVRQLDFARYTLLDLSSAMLDRARERLPDARLAFIAADAMSTELDGDAYDAVLGCDIIHHLDDPVGALHEWYRVARPGARLVVLETNPLNPLHLRYIGAEHELRSWINTDANLLRWAKEAGWASVSVVPAPVFTPPGPRGLGWLLDAIDHVGVCVPGLRRLTGLWLVTGSKPAA
jgi:ubiquinone/menaquinone biosynthesis C-methylase UbiE